MKVIKNIDEMRELCRKIKIEGETVGFVPTMGALHNGHLALIDLAKKNADFIVVSIFVNPLQFGPNEDFNRYPRRIENDIKLLEEKLVDAVFLPDKDEMYPKDFDTYIEVKKMSSVLCGKSRPGHFNGVCTVVAKLFNIVMPDIAIFGEKDAQQARIIEKMVKDLNFPIKILTHPIVRESDGLACSSRNEYLTTQQRKDATILYTALMKSKKLIEKGESNAKKVKEEIKKIVLKKECEIDYIEIVDRNSLMPIEKLNGEIMIALAVKFGNTRLIDNLQLKITRGVAQPG